MKSMKDKFEELVCQKEQCKKGSWKKNDNNLYYNNNNYNNNNYYYYYYNYKTFNNSNIKASYDN